MNEFKDKDESGVKLGFNISYNASLANKNVHKAFQEFADEHTDGGYLQAIKKLLEFWEGDWKFEVIYQRILTLEDKIILLEKRGFEEKTEPKGIKTFGGDELNG